MRKLIALFACSFVLLHASAAEPAVQAAKPTPDAAKKAADTARLAAELAKPASVKGVDKAAAIAAAADKQLAEKQAAEKQAAEKAAADKAAKAPLDQSSPVKATATAATADRVAAAVSAQGEDEAQVDLSVKIAARLAEMRARQQARVAAAAKAKKAHDARRRKQAALAATVAATPKFSQHWSYDGEFGPEHWGKINPAWAQCGKGSRQSPIDIRDGMKVNLDEIDFQYGPSTFTEIDNGHTVQVNVAGGNIITVGPESYELVQFHFHRPSEERVNGKGTEMVVHLVHRGAGGKLAVVAVLLERGKANEAIQTVWNNIPLEKGQLASPGIELDPIELLPQRREYYTYMGSMTEPPCTENVVWMVMKQPMTASPAQMALFSRLYPLNARPIQAGGGRMVKESN